MSFEIIDFIPEEADEKLLESYFDFAETTFMEIYPTDPLVPRDLHLKLLLITRTGEKVIRKLARSIKTREIIGRLYLMIITEENTGFKENKHSAIVYINVLKDNNYDSVSQEFLKEAIIEMQKQGYVTTVDTCGYLEREWHFWEGLGAKLALEGAQNRLFMEDIDWDMIEEWRHKGHELAKKEKVDLFSFERCPEGIILEYTATYSEIIRLMPLGEFDFIPEPTTPFTRREKEENHKKTDHKWYTIATREKDGRISGLTEILYSESSPHKVEQMLTGVKPEYRGRGLGKWLKAEMMVFIKNKFPEIEFISTGNADMNAPMISINDRMGFKRVLKEKCYTMKLEKLEKIYFNQY
ncbi:MAG: GNAT family N-acetyltransferase [Candidatus Heimdallarchaeaceae archaeon]